MADDNDVSRDYRVRLFYKTKPEPSKAAILDKMQVLSEGFAPRDGKRDSDRLDFRHPRFVANIGGKSVGATWSIREEEIEYPGDLTPFLPALEQSWLWDDAEQVVGDCEHQLLITDQTAANMRPIERLQMMQFLVSAVVEATACDAIYWEATEQFLDPQKFVAGLHQFGAKPWKAPGAFNVRVSRVIGYGERRDDESRDMIIDSLGLGILGWPDFQCHFRGLDWREIQQIIYENALEVFENGPKLQDGQAFTSVKATQVWKCRYEEALLGPPRKVIDIDPGIPYCAGLRYAVTAGVYVK
ncbi:DUF4261 domain-containing protein [Bremerella sp. JC817]|uniref:DUF4261 domain-containing protein n=1 Tax=Bremerella sp. JC817 TaxID=3231756 RepID=UPI00345A51B6